MQHPSRTPWRLSFCKESVHFLYQQLFDTSLSDHWQKWEFWKIYHEALDIGFLYKLCLAVCLAREDVEFEFVGKHPPRHAWENVSQNKIITVVKKWLVDQILMLVISYVKKQRLNVFQNFVLVFMLYIITVWSFSKHI